jgi:predicted nucleotidyltransferase component of viral defense system
MKIDLLSRAQLSIANKNNFRYPLAIAEKDYLLAVVLQIIYNSKLKDTLIFKGGTAIHHLYLNQLRFSEDLDFATSEYLTIEDVKEVFSPYDFLEIVKLYASDFALKVERLKFTGPLGQPNSIKIDIDLTQRLVLPPTRADYQNIYGVSATVSAMDLIEICAEKVRAINERARYRDFYDLALVMEEHAASPNAIIEILKQKELRKPLSKDSILKNLEFIEEARRLGAENLYYREEIALNEIKKALDGLLECL